MPRKKRHVQATFGPRGQHLWDALSPKLNVGQRVLLDEACRIADRLDGLEHILAGDKETWIIIRDGRTDDLPAQLIINSAMAEARMQATALRQIIAELQPRVAADEGTGSVAQTGGSTSDDLARRRRERLAASAN